MLDTNTVISGLLWKGTPHELLNAARDDQDILLYSSPKLLAELIDVLGRSKFDAAVAATGDSRETPMQRFVAVVHTIVPAPIAPVVISDPDDDHVLACAIAALADIVVSGDSDLLSLGTYRGIPIVTAVEALTQLANRQ